MHFTMGKNTSCAENPDHGSQMPKKYPKTLYILEIINIIFNHFVTYQRSINIREFVPLLLGQGQGGRYLFIPPKWRELSMFLARNSICLKNSQNFWFSSGGKTYGMKGSTFSKHLRSTNSTIAHFWRGSQPK